MLDKDTKQKNYTPPNPVYSILYNHSILRKCHKTCLRYQTESTPRKTDGIERTAKQREMVKSLIGGNLIHSLVLETGSPGRQGPRLRVSSSHCTSQGNSCLQGRAVSGQASWSHFCWFGPLWVHSPNAGERGTGPGINLGLKDCNDSPNTLDGKHLLWKTWARPWALNSGRL